MISPSSLCARDSLDEKCSLSSLSADFCLLNVGFCLNIPSATVGFNIKCCQENNLLDGISLPLQTFIKQTMSGKTIVKSILTKPFHTL